MAIQPLPLSNLDVRQYYEGDNLRDPKPLTAELESRLLKKCKSWWFEYDILSVSVGLRRPGVQQALEVFIKGDEDAFVRRAVKQKVLEKTSAQPDAQLTFHGIPVTIVPIRTFVVTPENR